MCFLVAGCAGCWLLGLGVYFVCGLNIGVYCVVNSVVLHTSLFSCWLGCVTLRLIGCYAIVWYLWCWFDCLCLCLVICVFDLFTI